MLHARELRVMVDLQQRSYRLLLWLTRHADRGVLTYPAVHVGIADEVAARQWIEANWNGLPADARPKGNRELEPFANLFGSYLVNSFDLLPDPGVESTPGSSACECPVCTRIVARSHLQPKKVLHADKRRARALKYDHVVALAAESGTHMDDPSIDALIDDADLRRDLAVATYAEQLLQRSRGESEGPAVLALWREFAWTKGGSPDPDFELDAEAILRAELRVATRIDPAAPRIFVIHAVQVIAGRTSPMVVSAPGGLVRADALGLRIGDAVHVRRPDGSSIATRITGIAIVTPNLDRQACLGLGPEATTATVPIGSELWLGEPRDTIGGP